ncbi:MAG: hypothetical protein Q9177_003348 [Variospora cf. flavescens]
MFLVSRRRPRIIRYFLFAVVIVPILDFLWSYQSAYPLVHFTASAQHVKNTRSVFIASSVWNSGSLLQDHWIPSLLQVAGDLKAANISVFISIYENGSWDSTKSVLKQLKQTLEGKGIPHEIVIDDISHNEIIGKNASSAGWLSTAHGKEMRRIPYLATVRNEALKPLRSLTDSGTSFDKLVFINDVVFQKAADVMTLLNTRDGQYAAACALDFLNPPWNRVDAKTRGLHPPGMYDDFATRDSDSNIIASHLYPYFSSKLSIAFDAAPFQDPTRPLRFRGIPDSLAQLHVEASECCTIHFDNPLSTSRGVWINPAVRVGYSPAAYNAVSAVQGGDDKSIWPTKSELRWGYWSSKWVWWLRDPGRRLSVWKTRYRIHRWQRDHAQEKEPALSCGSDLAMVLTPNGWAMRGARFE